MTKSTLSKESIVRLLTSGEDVEFEDEQSNTRFNFSEFYEKHAAALDKMTINSCLTFLKSRQAIMKTIKNTDFKFGSFRIKKTPEKVGPDEMTFRRLDTMIRVKIIEHAKTADNEKIVREKLKTHPLVMAYGIKLDSGKATMLACLLGGSLPLLASKDNFEMICLVLAAYQDGKAKELGINTSKYNPAETVAKVCTVLRSKEFTIGEEQLKKAKGYIDILKACDPKMKGALAMEHYADDLKKIYDMLGVASSSASASGGFNDDYP